MEEKPNEELEKNKRELEVESGNEKIVIVIKKKNKTTKELKITTQPINLLNKLVANFEEFDFANELNNLDEKEGEIKDLNQQEHIPHNKSRNELEDMKVNQLKELVQNITFHNKTHFHWSWIQLKKDLIDVLMEPDNPKFKKKK